MIDCRTVPVSPRQDHVLVVPDIYILRGHPYSRPVPQQFFLGKFGCQVWYVSKLLWLYVQAFENKEALWSAKEGI